MEGINFEETFAHVARLESVRILLTIVCSLKMKLLQMDVKSAFLIGILSEEVYVGILDLSNNSNTNFSKIDL